MKSGSELGSEAGSTATDSPGSAPPSPEELAQQFPQLEILELLGQGGMGIVYKARQPRLDRLVALKILPPEAGRDPAFAERFAREARALAKLTHPSIVTVYDFGESGGRFYLLMEFVDGLNLRQLLRERRLRPEEALQVVPQICEALQYAHEQGVVHRDIKPENILLDRKGHVKIADFGLAKLLGQKATDSALTGSQQVMGTPHYMAPEQMERPLAVDHRADIYSLGVVFYEMLTGELPLGRFAPPSQKVQVDVRLDEVVLRALEKEPERRYQHASDVKAEVETIQNSASGAEVPHASHKHTDLRERRMALTEALNAHDQEAIKSFLDPAFVARDRKGRVVATYWQLLDQMTALFHNHPEYHQSLAIESIDEEDNVLRIVTRRVESMKVLWFFPANYTSRWVETWKMVNGSWLCEEERAIGYHDPASEQLERMALSLLPENKIAAIQAYRQKTGASLSEAKEAVEAIARKHGLALSPSSLLNSPDTWGILLCVMGIAAGFTPAVIRHLNPSIAGYNVYKKFEPHQRREWVSVPDTGMFRLDGELSPEWCSITATFLALGLFLIGTHSVRRMAIRRGIAMLLAGTVLLVIDVVRAQPMFGSAELSTTPYIGFYIVVALAVGLLILGAMTLRFALMDSSLDPDAQAMTFWRRKLHSLWQSVLSLSVGSRVKEAGSHSTEAESNDAHLSGSALDTEQPVSHHADLPARTPEADSVSGSSMMPVNPVGSAAPALTNQPFQKPSGTVIKVAKAFLLIVFTCCLILFLSVNASGSPRGHRIQVGFPSPWFEAEGSPTAFTHHVNLLSWSWAIAALGALSCSLYGAIRKRETAKLSALEKLGSRGCLLWLLIVLFALVVVSGMALWMMTQEWAIVEKESKSDKERIQGTWVVRSVEEAGKSVPVKVVTAMAFSSDKVKVIKEDEEQEGSFRLDPTQNPKRIDLLIEGLSAPGIYSLEDDRLTICLNLEEHGKRPRRFATDAKTPGWRLMTLKRQQTDLEAIQGRWVAVSADYNGRRAPEEEVRWIALTFQGHKVVVKGFKGNDQREDGNFRLDPTQAPKWIDLEVAEKRMSGIYVLEVDRLTICFNQNEASERPKTFATDRETELSLIVLKRQKQ
jgi:uncharacterized protein (TIGR03067 family)